MNFLFQPEMATRINPTSKNKLELGLTRGLILSSTVGGGVFRIRVKYANKLHMGAKDPMREAKKCCLPLLYWIGFDYVFL